MSWPGLPLFLKIAGRPVILVGDGEAALAKRRLLERAGAVIVGEAANAPIAIVAIDDEEAARTVVERLRARGVLVNAVDRPQWCDFTLPAIVDRDPVLVAIGTGGASAGLAAALRQRLEQLLPPGLGGLARALHAARETMRGLWPDPTQRRRHLARALSPGGAINPLRPDADVERWLANPAADNMPELLIMRLGSPDPDDLSLRQARALAHADRVLYRGAVPTAILDRARADAERTAVDRWPEAGAPGLTLCLEMVA